VDAFVSGAGKKFPTVLKSPLLVLGLTIYAKYLKGTGGTISGVGTYLKRQYEGVRVVLADPSGSGLFNKVRPHQKPTYHEFALTISIGKTRSHVCP
jgi:hypothetical protein